MKFTDADLDAMQAGDLVDNLSEATVSSLLALYEDNVEAYPEWETSTAHPLYGKFVRLGRAIILGTALPFGVMNEQGKRQQLIHSDIARVAMERMTEANHVERHSEVAGRVTLDGQYMLDAGMYMFLDVTDDKRGLVFTNESTAYGRADEDGRLETVSIARTILHDSMLVIPAD